MIYISLFSSSAAKHSNLFLFNQFIFCFSVQYYYFFSALQLFIFTCSLNTTSYFPLISISLNRKFLQYTFLSIRFHFFPVFFFFFYYSKLQVFPFTFNTQQFVFILSSCSSAVNDSLLSSCRSVFTFFLHFFSLFLVSLFQLITIYAGSKLFIILFNTLSSLFSSWLHFTHIFFSLFIPPSFFTFFFNQFSPSDLPLFITLVYFPPLLQNTPFSPSFD